MRLLEVSETFHKKCQKTSTSNVVLFVTHSIFHDINGIFRVFHSLYKVGRNGNFVFKGFNNSKKKLPPVGLDLVQEIIAGLGVQCLTI